MNGAVCRVCSGPAAKREHSDLARIEVVGAAAQDHEDRSTVVGDGLCTCYTMDCVRVTHLVFVWSVKLSISEAPTMAFLRS